MACMYRACQTHHHRATAGACRAHCVETPSDRHGGTTKATHQRDREESGNAAAVLLLPKPRVSLMGRPRPQERSRCFPLAGAVSCARLAIPLSKISLFLGPSGP